MQQIAKSMTRRLTPEERQEVLDYMKAHPSDTMDSVAAYFEAKFNMPITITRLLAIAFMGK